jgi:hypothetical protein
MTRRLLVDLAWGLVLFAIVSAIVVLGTSGPKFIYIDF